MDNPLQAAGAARGIGEGAVRGIRRNDIPCLIRRDARPCVSTLTDGTTTKVPKGHNFHNRRSATCGIGEYHSLCPEGRTYRLPMYCLSGSSLDVHYRRSATCGISEYHSLCPKDMTYRLPMYCLSGSSLDVHYRRSATCGIGEYHSLCPEGRTYRLPMYCLSGSSLDVHYRRSATCGISEYHSLCPEGRTKQFILGQQRRPKLTYVELRFSILKLSLVCFFTLIACAVDAKIELT